jgi:threonine dehydrogenase-like Zn-dependent dehydrogenase
VRVEERAAPTILEPTDAVIRLSATCICGSDLWPYRGISATNGPTPMGHEYCGIVEDVGRAVRTIKPGQFVIGSLTRGVGADAVLECVGTQESMMQAIRATRPGGSVGYVGVPAWCRAAGRGIVLHARPPSWRGPRPCVDTCPV